MKSKILLFAFLIISAGCGRSSNNISKQREMFDARHQEVITCWANQSQETMSILFGNCAAIKSTLNGNRKHHAGEVYTLTTWRQFDNPHWYGSYINGKIKSVETVNFLQTSTGDVVAKYCLLIGQQMVDSNGKNMDEDTRISFIVNQKPSIFP